ncbi:DUF433 domain-containing protein [Rhizobium laguerreae]|uniref:DUF433 domain-containing protein n=2 Tax=Rhizobium laguerreae TaxID=1076926 RepID=A0A1S9GXY1_9HYPH|nr:DUF433 domain-containing protein [Rhizobium laguerreae]MBB3162312.1 uncharacterized protein (DUF433 family) [Rhizobium laguerreae]MBY3062212.1 DUF433 domain-containing protein [Rhizobium laguerreae]MBY3070193.1 DUF433 domain-containing protein [Rhizobium laguerreae]MBY3077407.1 DUF433 domain-containing protein [Rhizobium laguerreae]MBY3083597.1 DUF433 domain-containing protein [Rhizobium laguerreae]
MVQDKENSVIAAFTEEQVERLTGVTLRQLRHWDRTKFFVPTLAYEDRSQPFSRLYSFRDLVSLKVLSALRNDSKVSLQHLRGVKDKLAHLGDALWSKTTLYVLKRKVVFDNPESKTKEEVLSGQGVLQIPLEVVTGNMKDAVAKMKERKSSSVGKIESKKGIANSRPVIAGTRIPVDTIKAFAAEGYSIEKIRMEYPTLTTEDILAAISYEAAA